MRDVAWISGFLAKCQQKRDTTCSLTEARMLLAVLSASMLRPVELSRMVSRSPSSVTGLCSGAGIPPAWNTHAHTHRHIWSGHRGRSSERKKIMYTHTRLCACMCKHTHNTLLSKPLPETHRRVMRSDYQWPRAAATTSKTQNTHPHTPYGPKRKRLSMFHVCDSANQCHMALRQHTS